MHFLTYQIYYINLNLTFCSSFNQSQHDASIEIAKQHCDWMKDEKKDVISDVRSIVQECDWKKADVLGLKVLLLSNPFDFNFQKWSLCNITCINLNTYSLGFPHSYSWFLEVEDQNRFSIWKCFKKNKYIREKTNFKSVRNNVKQPGGENVMCWK